MPAPGIGLLAGEADEFFEVWLEDGEIGFFAGFGPDVLGDGGSARPFFDQADWEFSGFVVGAFPAADVGGGGVAGVWGGGGGGGFVEPAADFGGRGQAVAVAAQAGELFSAPGHACGRQERFLIPAEDSGGGAKQGGLAKAGVKFLVGGFGHGGAELLLP